MKMNKVATGGLALAGLVVIGLLFFFWLIPAWRLGNVDSAIGSLRTLNNGLREYATAHPEQGFPKRLQEIHGDESIDEILVRGVRNQYRFVYLPGVSAEKGRIDGYQIHADPTDKRNRVHFFTDETGVVRYKEDAPASEQSPAI